MHYGRMRRNGSLKLVRVVEPTGLPCKVEGCPNVGRGRGLCQTHYSRLQKHGTPADSPGVHDVEARIRVYSIPQDSGCVLWSGPIGKKGYPAMTIDCKAVRINRYVLAKKLGRSLKKGMYACHTCHNPGCISAEHLYEGTPAENSRDMVESGRSSRGDRNPNSRLSAKDVKVIRFLAENAVKYATIAEMFGCNVPNVGHIVARRNWKHVS